MCGILIKSRVFIMGRQQWIFVYVYLIVSFLYRHESMLTLSLLLARKNHYFKTWSQRTKGMLTHGHVVTVSLQLFDNINIKQQTFYWDTFLTLILIISSLTKATTYLLKVICGLFIGLSSVLIFLWANPKVRWFPLLKSQLIFSP